MTKILEPTSQSKPKILPEAYFFCCTLKFLPYPTSLLQPKVRFLPKLTSLSCPNARFLPETHLLVLVQCQTPAKQHPKWPSAKSCLALYAIFNRVIDSLESNFLIYVYILDISPLSDVELVKIFSQSVGCRFILLTLSFALSKLCNFMRSHLSILDLTAQATAVLFRNFSSVPISSRLFPTFSSINFSVFGFMWRSLIHLDLSFVQGNKNGLIHKKATNRLGKDFYQS